jgi:hypothetical protein
VGEGVWPEFRDVGEWMRFPVNHTTDAFVGLYSRHFRVVLTLFLNLFVA